MVTAIRKTPSRLSPNWPKHGYYVRLHWSRLIGAMTKTDETTVGPFPESATESLIEFLNVLEAMELPSSNSKNYDTIPGYGKWFHKDSYETPFGLLIETPYDDADKDREYEFTGYHVYYHDGLLLSPYCIDIEKTDDEREPGPDGIKSEFLQYLPQYHFERSMFVDAFNTVLEELAHEIQDMCTGGYHTESFTLDRDEDEFYILHRPSGTLINWYKHLGRTNTCNKPGFGIDDLYEMLLLLKMELLA